MNNGSKKPQYDRKHFVSALAQHRHQKRSDVRTEAEAAFAKYLASGETPLWVTSYDGQLEKKAETGVQLRLHNPKWKTPRQQVSA